MDPIESDSEIKSLSDKGINDCPRTIELSIGNYNNAQLTFVLLYTTPT
jgi:hypothetical protein